MILVVPATEPGRGGGHLVRSTKLVNELQTLGKEAILYESTNYTNEHELDIELIILDRFQTPPDELKKWKELAPVIGIDEGGSCRDEFDFLIDILPNLEKVKANISDIGLLPLPFKKPHAATRRRGEDAKEGRRILTQRAQRSTRSVAEKLKVLISFGMEDSAGLGEKVYKKLKDANNIELTYLNSDNKIPNLAEHLHEYDLVITHFGLTAFECVYVGTLVILINPTPYHEKLSKKAGFKTIKNINFFSLRRRVAARIFSKSPRNSALKKIKPKSLAELITTFSPQINRACPVCGAASPSKAIARFQDRVYRRCKNCGIIYMDRINPVPIKYGKEYFFESYKKQYGKTYLEDFPNLIAAAKKRLKIIKRISHKDTKAQRPQKDINRIQTQSLTLLDIGCAYGAFLSAAREEGFNVHGIDPSKEAIKYVTENLGIQATHGFFPDNCSLFTVHCSMDVVSLWFTIEHFQNCVPVLKEIYPLLKTGGILAFSTPSFSGISGRKNLYTFLKNSPGDHFTVWSPKTSKKALSIAGFKVKKIASIGHHPERFPLLGRLAKSKRSPIYWLLLTVSKIFSLGDSFEVYAEKG